ncbi:MAG TPA: hypothetical protein VGY56_06660 [Verrucomicrobiae bacterium]|nr:hypothetical protein [Verrucomicrobiae bacterium]
MVKATPYASCITNNNGTIQFYLNESGGTVVVTYGDGATNVNFDGQVTGLNLPSGLYSFSMGAETSYAIAVTKMGTGSAGIEPNVIQNTNGVPILTTVTNLFVIGDPRGLAVNINPASPYFGRIYLSRGGNAATGFFDLNSDGSVSTAGPNGTNAGVTTWSPVVPYSSPDRISIASNDDLVVGDWSTANAGVWLVGPNLDSNELLLGPISFGNGNAAGVHGDEVGGPILLGNLATGATLLTVDSDLSTVLPNSLLVYSNITSTAIAGGSGWQNPPSRVGPEVAIDFASGPGSSVYLFPSLCVGPNGYIYSGEYRGGVNGSLGTGDPAGVQVYGYQITNRLFSSRYNGGKSDYFCTAAAGGSQCLPTDLAVSPDGKYLATVGVDNHLTICVLTNGIPDVPTIYTVPPLNFGGEYADGACEVKWDRADNLYVLAAGTFGLTTWTLGQSATCTTYGNLNGTTNFAMVSLNPTVDVYATNNPVISQNNSYGNPTSGTFTIDRSGSLSLPLTVNFTYSGTATNGTYTAGSSGSVVLQSGQAVTNISIAAVSDGIPRKTIYLTLTITPSTSYTLGVNPATISILNTATPELIPSVGQSSMYNAFSNDFTSILITRLGDTNTTETLAAGNFTLAGTAGENTDYAPPTTVTFHPGDLTQTTYIYPLAGGLSPTHNPNLTYTGNKTVVLSIPNGSGYYAVTNAVTVNIIDSAYPAAQMLFFDPLTNALDATNWNVTAANDNLSQSTPDVDPQFGFNLYNAQYNPVPPPPNGASNALMVTVNKSSGTGGTSPATAINLYLTNQVFGGNYAVRFNMNVIEGDCSSLESGSFNPEEGALFGFNHNGAETNLFFPAFALGETITNFAADGVFYWVSDSGGRYDNIYTPYQGFIGNGSPSTNTGWAFTGTATSGSFVTQFKTNVFTCYASVDIAPNFNSGWTEGGPGLPVNGSQTLGLSMNSWADVELKQVGKVDSLWIDKTLIMSYTNNTGLFTNGYVMLGYEDPYDGGETPDTAVYYSNLRVVALTAPAISGPLAYSGTGKTFTFDFSSSDGDLTPSSFTVLGSTNLLTGYKAVPATITQLIQPGAEEFQAMVSKATNSIEFYRVQEK